MKTTFAKTNLEVTSLCLGTVNYGSDLPEKDSIRQLYEYTEMGGNFIDTAHIYGDWNPGDGPLSEITIGKWIAESGRRQDIIISTKGAHPNLETMNIPRCSPEEIVEDLDASLGALRTDYVDLYFLHRDDPSRPVGEFLETLEAQVKAGKIRYYGCSNWSLARVKEAEAYAKTHNLQGFSCNQLMWSLPKVTFDNLPDKSFVLMDKKTYDYYKETNGNVMAYMALARGYFSKKYVGVPIPEDLRAIYENDASNRIYNILKDVVSEEATMIDYTLQYLQTQPFATIPIVSCNNSRQLKAAMHSLEAKCDSKVLEKLRNNNEV